MVLTHIFIRSLNNFKVWLDCNSFYGSNQISLKQYKMKCTKTWGDDVVNCQQLSTKKYFGKHLFNSFILLSKLKLGSLSNVVAVNIYPGNN